MYYFIVNPNSRSGRGGQIWDEIHQQLLIRRISFEYCLTKYSGHATKIAREASLLGTVLDPVNLIAVGGDGTIHEVLTGITDFDRVIFGYIPTGSGNDFCRSMHLPSDPMESLEYILKRKHIGTMDVPYLTRADKISRFGISTGIGYDAGVCQEVLSTPLKKIFNKLRLGKLIYLFIALKQLIFITPGKMTITMDQKQADPVHPDTGNDPVQSANDALASASNEFCVSYDHVYFTAVMNQKYEGGGFMFCPDARSDDRLLDVILVEGVGKLKLLCCLPTAFFGKHTGIHGIHIYQCKNIHIQSEASLPIHIDGESGGIHKDLTVSFEKKPLKIILPVV